MAHEGFADEEGFVAGGLKAGDVFGVADAAFGDLEDVLRHRCGEFDEALGVNGEGAEVATVDADEVEAEGNGAVEFFAVVSLAEDVEADGVGLVSQVGEGGVGVGGDDEEDGVGTGGAGFEDLEGVEDEVLAEAGELDDAGGLFEVGEGALEELLVGEDGEGGGAGGLE